MNKKDKKSLLIEYLENAQKEVLVTELVEKLNISDVSVRRYLRELNDQGVITRTHGGAKIRKNGDTDNSDVFEYPLEFRKVINVAEKRKICKYAASLINDGDTIFVDNSSTTSFLLEYINPNYSISFISNSFNLLLKALEIKNPNFTFISLGGTFCTTPNFSFYGVTTIEHAKNYYPVKAFYSCAALRADGIMTDIGLVESDIKKVMIGRSVENYFLIDHSKFDLQCQIYIASLKDNLKIIMDDELSERDKDIVNRWGDKIKLV